MISAFGVQHSVSKNKASREEYKEGRNRYLDEKSEYRTEYKVSAKGASGREKRKLKALKQSKISDSRAANLSTTKIGARHEKVIGYLAGRAIGGNMENKRQRQNRIDAAKHRRANVYKGLPSALKAAAKGKKALPDVKDMKRNKYISGKMDANSYGRLSSQFHASARKTDDPSNYFGAFAAGREGLFNRVAAQAALK